MSSDNNILYSENVTKPQCNSNTDSLAPLSPTCSTYNPRTPNRFYSSNAIDLMEKEQEGVVLKLMNEINILREENKALKNIIKSNSSSYFSSSPASISYNFTNSSSDYNPLNYLSPVTSSSSISTQNYLSQRRATISTPTNMKRIPASFSNSNSNSSSNSNISTPLNRSRSNSFSLISLKSPINSNLDHSYFDTEIFIKNKRGGHLSKNHLQIAPHIPSLPLNNFKKSHRHSVSDNYIYDQDTQFRNMHSTPSIAVPSSSSSSSKSNFNDSKNNNESSNLNKNVVSPGLLITQKR